ncbi:hypothetical protein QYE76_012076 [Lolium multiflorum]|uniref:Uncharacterized protein n=1 Tax=Lolium multiflorum TaxID=4521 RepID=A0AAD8U0D1_LOLMU|nr:hypothetical protein QYE76_012076 [Lolium multiflorum]
MLLVKQVHTASRFASGAASVHFNGASIPDLNRTPRSGDSCPGARQKTRQVSEESMSVPHTLFEEIPPSAPMMDNLAYWTRRNEGDIQAMIFGGGFVGDPMQETTVCVDDYEEAPTGSVLTTYGGTKKKGESHRTYGFNDEEDK